MGTATPTSTVEFVSDAAENAFPVASPLEGTAVALPTVSDPMFAGGKLGQGVAVEPTVVKRLRFRVSLSLFFYANNCN